MAAKTDREPDRHFAGEQPQSEAKMEAGSRVGHGVLLIHNQHASLMLLIETGVLLHVQPHPDLPVHTHVRAYCPPANERRDSPGLAGVFKLAGPSSYVRRQVLAQHQVLVKTRLDTEGERAARVPTLEGP